MIEPWFLYRKIWFLHAYTDNEEHAHWLSQKANAEVKYLEAQKQYIVDFEPRRYTIIEANRQVEAILKDAELHEWNQHSVHAGSYLGDEQAEIESERWFGVQKWRLSHWEKWHYGEYHDNEMEHRLLGPAITVANHTSLWAIRGRQVDPFDRLLEDPSLWKEYLAGSSSNYLAIIELHREGLIDIDEMVYENLILMTS